MASPRIAVCQFEVERNVLSNLDQIRRFASEAAASGADLTLFPEMSIYPIGAPGIELFDVASRLKAEIAPVLSDVAMATRTILVVGVVEPSSRADKVLNTVLVIGSDGVAIGAYRKIHLYDAFGSLESDRFLAGPLEPFSFDAVGYRFGIATCYDLRFPELARALVDDGAEVLLVPAAWVHGMFKEEHWQTLLQARAIESTVYVAAADQCGIGLTGRSAIVDPAGVVLCALAEVAGVTTSIIDRNRIENVRERVPVLANRRLRPTYETTSQPSREEETNDSPRLYVEGRSGAQSQ